MQTNEMRMTVVAGSFVILSIASAFFLVSMLPSTSDELNQHPPELSQVK